MGYMEVKNVGTWGDNPQDVVDSYLGMNGFNIDNKYTKKQRLKFYNKAIRNKNLEERFRLEFAEGAGRMPTRKEFLYHIRFGVGMLDVSHPFSNSR